VQKWVVRWILFSLLPGTVFAASSAWIGPGDQYRDDANWTAGIPTDIAEFNTAPPTSISLSVPTTVNTLQYNPGASAYSVRVFGGQLNGASFNLEGAGVVNNSGTTQTLVNDGGRIRFRNTAGAGNAVIVNSLNAATVSFAATFFEDTTTADRAQITNNRGCSTEFSGTSTAANSTIVNNGGTALFLGNSNAGNASITNNNALGTLPGVTSFADTASAGNAVITTNLGSRTDFGGSSTGGTAQLITNAGGQVDISRLITPGLALASISGAGSYILGSKNLEVGGTNADMTVAGVISGSGGSLTKSGTGILTLAGDNTFTGVTTINAGTVELPGSLIGGVTVGSAGLLTGVGSLGALVNNGQVSPGSAASGVLHAASYAGPGNLNIFFDGASHNQLQTSGNANITQSTLNLTGTSFTPGEYSVVSAGSLSGPFAVVNKPASAFLTIVNRYTATDAFVDVNDNGATFTSVAESSNQSNVATVLDTLKGSSSDINQPVGDVMIAPERTIHDAITAITQLSAPQARSAFAQLSGDALTYFSSVGRQNASLFDHQMNERAHPAGAVVTAGMEPPIQLAYTGDIRELGPLANPAPNNGLWVRGLGFVDHTDGDSSIGSPASKSTTGGAQAGYDHKVGESGLIGFAGGYAETNLNVEDRASSGDSKAGQGGLYGSYTAGPWFMNLSGGYTQADNHMTRGIDLPGIAAQANSSFKSRTYTGFGELGYAIRVRERTSLEPSVSLEANHIDQDAFTESGATGMNLSVDDQKVDSLASSLGLRLAQLFAPQSAHPVILGVRGAWQHEFHDINNQMSARFAETPTGNFQVQGTPQNRNAAALGLDGRVDLYKTLQAFANYAATVSSGKTDHGILGGLSLKW
jgi:autotransporter-associated beta strand protein